MKNLQKKANFTSFFDPSRGKSFSGFLIEGSSGEGSGGNNNSKKVNFKIESGKIDKIKELKSSKDSSSSGSSGSSGSNQNQNEDLLISLKEVPYCDENGETGFILLMCSDPYSESIADSFGGYAGISNESEGSSEEQRNPWDLE